MNVRVTINQQGISVDETFHGNTADDIVGAVKQRVAREVNFAVRMVVNSMSNLGFAQEVVRRYNEANRKNIPIPSSCEEFLSSAEAEGFARMERN